MSILYLFKLSNDTKELKIFISAKIIKQAFTKYPKDGDEELTDSYLAVGVLKNGTAYLSEYPQNDDNVNCEHRIVKTYAD